MSDIEMKEWIDQRVSMIANGFGKGQIKRECWSMVMMEYGRKMTIEGMIYLSMDIYAEIIKKCDK